jgi:3-phytase
MRHRPLSVAVALLLAGCAVMPTPRPEPDQGRVVPLLARENVPHAIVHEAFVTERTPADNVDSPSAWAAPDGRLWLFATAKETGRLLRYDGETGATLGSYGSVGDARGEFRRPNGIFVHRDLLFVVERDNHRVQVLKLPALDSLGSFGDADLTQPYGLWLRERDDGSIEAMISDAYMAGEYPNGDDIAPPLPELDKRFKRYAVDVSGATVQARLLESFGDTTREGAIRIPESLWGDVARDRLLIAEEDTRSGTAVREYDLAGRYRGRTIGRNLFKAQAEGIALWQCADGSGYWITTDQFADRSVFHVFDRDTLRHLGAFAGDTVANTDGVWLHAAPSARFPAGVFYAVHDDQAVGAFDWRDIASQLKLRTHCGD